MIKKKVNDLAPLPPNFANLNPELRALVEEQIYKQQSIGAWGYGEDDERLTSSDKIRELYGNEEEK